MTRPTGTPLLEVLLSLEAEQDLLEIYSYTATNAGQEHADTILGKLEQAILSLENLHLRGNVDQPRFFVPGGFNLQVQHPQS